MTQSIRERAEQIRFNAVDAPTAYIRARAIVEWCTANPGTAPNSEDLEWALMRDEGTLGDGRSEQD